MTNDVVVDLLPCPFCGAAAYIDYDTTSGMFGPEADHAKGCLLQNWDMRDFADANLLTDVWNTRHRIEALAARDCGEEDAEALARAIRRNWLMGMYSPAAMDEIERHPVQGEYVAHARAAIAYLRKQETGDGR